MKLKRYFIGSSLIESYKCSKLYKSIICALIFIFGVSVNSAFATRFDPPSLKIQLESFDHRITSEIFNTDFLVAHVVNNSRKTVREVGELTEQAITQLQNTALFISDNNTSGATAGSVIIPPGTNAENIIVINQNEGDSIAIDR